MQKNINKTLQKYDLKFGQIISMVGAVLLIIEGIIVFGLIYAIEGDLQIYGESWISIGADGSLLYIRGIATLVLGIVALIGAIMALKFRILGGAFCILIGIISLVTPFVSIGYIDLTTISRGAYEITLSSWELIFDPFLIIAGGIISIYQKEKTAEELRENLMKKLHRFEQS
ncbi:MAG: hypothetical protein JW891_02120 [Candidatus Lokiarchaeota archaeon]|nr:hypothetical protein [Candidatus Lokiarchaeota archaeon]